MRTRRLPHVCLSLACGLLLVGSNAAHAQIEAVKGKNYRLTPQHGPWMIMVTRIRDVPEDRREDGLTAQQAADELVYELRQKGIPAYVYRQDSVVEKIDTQDRLGRHDQRIYAAQRGMISVLAGNYDSLEGRDAQGTLAWIKRYHPQFLRNKKSGGIYRETAPPLASAFLTINPLLDPEEVRRREMDPLIVRLNNSSQYSLLDAKGKYTLVIATFNGKYVIAPGTAAAFDKLALEFDKKARTSSTLNEAGEDANQLVLALRQREFEAYVYHDHYRSVVTVGAFDSPQDPRFQRGIDIFGAKMKQDPATRREVLVSEILTLPGNDPKQPLKTWIFDPSPQVMEIPRLK